MDSGLCVPALPVSGSVRPRVLLIVFLAVAATGLACDQIGKTWSFAPWREPAGLREIIPGLFAGAQGRNYGGIHSLEGFGSPPIRWGLTLAGFFALGMALRWAIILDRDRWRMIDALAGGLVLAGILGNQLDRLALGYVRDYLILASRPYEIFNSADVFMVLGTMVLLASMITRRRPQPPPMDHRRIPGEPAAIVAAMDDTA
jgi:signal peptidase II